MYIFLNKYIRIWFFYSSPMTYPNILSVILSPSFCTPFPPSPVSPLSLPFPHLSFTSLPIILLARASRCAKIQEARGIVLSMYSQCTGAFTHLHHL